MVGTIPTLKDFTSEGKFDDEQTLNKSIDDSMFVNGQVNINTKS